MKRLARLYDDHGAGLCRYARAILRDGAQAEDAVQQAFVRIAAWPDWLLRVRDPVRYLRRAVRNECYSALRRRRTEERYAATDGRIDEQAAPIRACGGGAASSDSPEVRLDLAHALAALAPEQREVVHLKVVEGLTFREIASVTRTSINTSASRYRYAMEGLHRALTRTDRS